MLGDGSGHIRAKTSYAPMSFSDRVAELAVARGIALGDGTIANIAALEKHWEEVEFELKFEITERCGLNCSFCHQEFGKKLERGRDFPFDAFCAVIDAAKTEKPIKYIRITGGEPTLHPGVRDFLEYAAAGFHTVLNTNAAPLTPERIAELAPYVGTWKVSLPAADEAGADAVTGVPGTWRKKLAALETLRGQKCNVELLIVMTPQNIDDLPKFIALAEKYGATYSFLRQESSASNRRPLTEKHIEKLLSVLEKTRSRLSLALPFCATGNMERAASLADGRIGCGPYSSLVVKADGTVHHCYSRRVSRARECTFLATAVRMAAEDFIALPEPCRECAYGAVCLGGCRCGFALRNSPVGPIDYLADLEHIQIYPSGEQG